MSEEHAASDGVPAEVAPSGSLREFHALFERLAPSAAPDIAQLQDPSMTEAAGAEAAAGFSGEAAPLSFAERAAERVVTAAPPSEEALRAEVRPPAMSAPLFERKRRVDFALPTVEANVQTWTLIGPAGAGKTSLISAFDAACFSRGDGDGELSITWNREGGQADEVQAAGHRWIAEDLAPASTREATAYSFELTVERPARWLRSSAPVVRQLRCSEDPGQSMFPVAGQRDEAGATASPSRITELATATSLLLVIDATRRCAATVEANLPGLLDRISSSRPGEQGWRESSAWIPRALQRRGPSTIRRTRLAARRILLLLTKIDLLADSLARESRELGASLSVAEAARAIDPVALAFQVIGPRCVRRLYHALGRDADLAVGVSSACGFSPAGDQTFHQWSAARSPQERIQAWEPFGVREALRFLATGQLGSTLHRIDASDLETTESMPLFSLPCPGAAP